jgi:ComF family protein
MPLFPTTSNANSKAQASPGLFAPVFKRTLLLLADLVFPPRCAGCGRVDDYWCAVCQNDIEQMPLMPRVRPLSPLADIASTGTHTGKLREAVQGLKYDNNRQLAQPLGERLAVCLAALNWTLDMIIPVPLHTKRLAERGYNQAQVIAEYLAAHTGLPCVPGAMRRDKFTRSQVELSAAARLVNLADAFQGDPALLADQTILLIDDVYTTGATLTNCAQAALAAGARAVYGLTVTAARSA